MLLVLVSGTSLTCTRTMVQQGTTMNHKVLARDYPSVFQAWYGIDMPGFPQDNLEQRLQSAAKHDLLWEEPLSQLGEGVELVLGLVWDHPNHGLAGRFTEASLAQARSNRKRLVELNPNMLLLMEIRWRDAPAASFPKTAPGGCATVPAILSKDGSEAGSPFTCSIMSMRPSRTMWRVRQK